MSRNYTAIHYIQNQLKGFNPKFVNCIIRCFDSIEKSQEPDGCLSNSVALFVCAKEFGYDPVLCYGLCKFEGKSFYHAWLELNEIVIDMAIYGNVNFSPLSLWDRKLDTPYIGTYEESNIHYGKFEFDEDWKYSMISAVEGMAFEQYMDGSPQQSMWRITCGFLDKTPTANLVNHLRTHVKNNKFERNKS